MTGTVLSGGKGEHEAAMSDTTFLIRPPRAGSTGPRQRHAVGVAVAAFQELIDQLPPEGLELFSARVRQALHPAGQANEGGRGLAALLTDGREYSAQERLALEVAALVRAFRRREELLADTLTAPQVARLLGVSRQTPHDRVRGGTLLAVLDRGQWRFPRWQFDPEGPDGVVAGLPDVLRALDVSPLAKVAWLVRPNPGLDDEPPLALLRRGEAARVLAAARGVEVS